VFLYNGVFAILYCCILSFFVDFLLIVRHL
jgi:hypothetical protein